MLRRNRYHARPEDGDGTGAALEIAERIMWLRSMNPEAHRPWPLLAVLATLAVPVEAEGIPADPMSSLAASAWTAVGVERRLAARPLDGDATGLPAELAAELDAALAAALLRTAPADSRLVDRAGMPRSWEEAAVFPGFAPGVLQREAAIDALLVPSAHAARNGIVLAATVVAVGGGDTGRLLAALAPVTLPGLGGRIAAMPPPEAAAAAGVALAEALRRDLDPGARFRAGLRFGGERSPFGDWFLGQVADRLADRLSRRPQYVSRPLRHGDADGRSLAVRLEAETWDRGDHVYVHLRAVAGAAQAMATVRLAAASLPASFQPLTSGGGRLGSGHRIADGAAVAGPELRRDELGAAAEAAARALIVEDALDLAVATPSVLRSRAEVADALRRLADAVPHGESWTGVATGPDAAARRLQARVARIGGPEAPELAASLDRAIVGTGETPRVVAAVMRGRAFLAVYLRRADGGIVRIEPVDGSTPAVVEAGRPVHLPQPRGGAAAAAAVAGAAESLESIIVVASAVPFGPGGLAALPGDRGTPATTTGAFLDALAGLDRDRLRLAILPYLVRPGG